jgi:hypothetical protein
MIKTFNRHRITLLLDNCPEESYAAFFLGELPYFLAVMRNRLELVRIPFSVRLHSM